MKVFLTVAVACLALATAVQVQPNQRQGTQGGRQGAGSGANLISGQQAVQLVGNSPHIVIGNRQLTGVAGYYVPVPYEILAEVSSPSGGAQLINQLRQNGILPIWNIQGNLIGLYVQSLGNNQQVNTNANTLIQNLAGIGLNPIVNQQNQVIGLYGGASGLTLGPNQVNQLQQQWNQVGNNQLNNAQQLWGQTGNNPLNNAQPQWGQRGNSPSNNGQQQGQVPQWSS